MGNFAFDNTYNLSSEQLERLDEAEELMLKGALGKAETLLLSMLEDEADCIPVLSNLGHLTADTCRIQDGSGVLRPRAVSGTRQRMGTGCPPKVPAIR
ncbi:MAG: hypothetical protein CM15mP78_07510 [Candidatus Poseidoniales archaeon]|nr:MAG: hypothetical protein CM15mP78_07510 [Candidatus Poseidoniales archaeon]